MHDYVATPRWASLQCILEFYVVNLIRIMSDHDSSNPAPARIEYSSFSLRVDFLLYAGNCEKCGHVLVSASESRQAQSTVAANNARFGCSTAFTFKVLKHVAAVGNLAVFCVGPRNKCLNENPSSSFSSTSTGTYRIEKGGRRYWNPRSGGFETEVTNFKKSPCARDVSSQ